LRYIEAQDRLEELHDTIQDQKRNLEGRTRKYDGDKWDRFKKERSLVLPVVTLRRNNKGKESKWFDKEAFG
jgi:hypothetical protein